jgi:hypothetical protein
MKHNMKPYGEFIKGSQLYKDELNLVFWKDEEFDQEVRTKLLQIATDFYTDLKIDAPIIDVHLTGSLANYNWTEYSDLDVHVILDFSVINDDIELVKKGLDGQRFIWNLRHPVSINGYDVELYAQDVNEPHIASGLFSLMKNEWITKPSYDPPSIDERDVIKKADAFIYEIEEIQNDVSDADSDEAREIQDRISALKQKIMKARKEGLARNGEFSIENLVFKNLRNRGWLEKLIKLGSKAYSHIYSEPNDAMDSELEKITESNNLGKGSLILLKGKSVDGGSRIFVFSVSWVKHINVAGTEVKMVGIENPHIIKNSGNSIFAKPIIFNDSTLKKYAGLSDYKVVLNSKSKTPYWREAINFSDVKSLVDGLSYSIRSIPDVYFPKVR